MLDILDYLLKLVFIFLSYYRNMVSLQTLANGPIVIGLQFDVIVDTSVESLFFACFQGLQTCLVALLSW